MPSVLNNVAPSGLCPQFLLSASRTCKGAVPRLTSAPTVLPKDNHSRHQPFRFNFLQTQPHQIFGKIRISASAAVSPAVYKKNYRNLIELVGSPEQQAVDFFRYYTETYPGRRLAVAYNGQISREMLAVAKEIQHLFTKVGQGSYLLLIPASLTERPSDRANG